MLTILGSGAFGRALHSAVPQGRCTCWGRLDDLSLQKALQETTVLILAVPAQAARDCLKQIQACLSPAVKGLVIASKGIEKETGMLLSEVALEILPSIPVGILSGPSLASEILEGQWTSVDFASTNKDLPKKILSFFKGGLVFLSLSEDVVGLQVAGALKNVFAIGYGFLQQCSAGDNVKATYLVLALKELSALGQRLGASTDTWAGYAGIGDLVLTCTSLQSRNARFGRNFSTTNIDPTVLVEGVLSAPAVLMRAQQMDLSMPLIESIQEVLAGRLPIQDFPACIKKTLTRASRKFLG